MSEIPFDNLDGTPEIPIVKKSLKRQKEDEGYFVGKRGYTNSILNVVKVITIDDDILKDLWRWNELIGDIEYAKLPPWNKRIQIGKTVDDGDIIFLTGWLAKEHHFEPPEKIVRAGLFLVAQNKYYHPIKEYLESLKWDGTPRLDKWMAKVLSIKNDQYYTLVGRKFICSMVHRIYRPGAQMDYMIIFEGREGIFKTTMLKILGGQWYAPFTGITHANFEKDAVDIMRGKWLMELAELTAVRRIEDFNRIKAFISCTEDRVRLSYRRDAQDFKRQCVLIGTMNPTGDNQYFRDPGENRRFWPVECGKHIDIDWIKENRDNLFAEAMQVWEKENLFLDNEDALKIAIEKQEDRKPNDVWVDIIDEWLKGKDIVSTKEIATDCLGIAKDKITLSNTTRIGQAMRHLQWGIKQRGKEKKKYYIRPGTDINKVNETTELWNEEENK